MMLLCVAPWLVRGPLFAALGADADLMPLLSSYWGPQLVAAWLGANMYFTFSLFRAWGDVRLSASLMIVTSLVNLAWQLVLGIAAAVLAPTLAGLLSGNPEIRDELATLIRALLPSCAFVGPCMVVVSAANALDWPKRAMALSAVRLFACYLPCPRLGARLGGVPGLAIGGALGNVLAGGAALWTYRRSIAARARAVEGVVARPVEAG